MASNSPVKQKVRSAATGEEKECSTFHSVSKKVTVIGTSLMAQWIRIHRPMQGTRIQSLVQEDPTCRGATKPVRHNY